MNYKSLLLAATIATTPAYADEHVGRVVEMQSANGELYVRFADGTCGAAKNSSPNHKMFIRQARMKKANITIDLKEIKQCKKLEEIIQ